MLITASAFSTLLQTLGLTQGLFKPTGITGTFLGTVVDNVNATSSNVTSSPLAVPTAVSDGGGGDLTAQAPPSSGTPISAISSPQNLDGNESSCQVGVYDGPSAMNQTFPPFDQAKANIFRYRQQQSVNIGSWFVHEQWMTPSVFTCASGKQLSELDIASGWGSTTNARAVLERHWDTFINQTDFQDLASIGINTVRLPIGYWTLGPYYCKDTPYALVADVYQNSWSRLVRAINMAGEAGIGVLVDLHGAVGSQNGQPHSGISDGRTNLFDDPTNVDKTIAVLSYLAQRLAPVTNVVGIQLLNEPQNVPQLADFYSRAMTSMRQVSPAAATLPLYIHDGFDLERFSMYVAGRTDFVVQDHHSYFVYTPSDEAEPADQHTSDIESAVAESLTQASTQQHRNLVVDEWSCALTPQSLANEANPAQSQKAFCTGQMEVYANTTAGWGFWSYDKENCSNDPGWCFKSAVGVYLPCTFFSYGQSETTDPAQLQSLSATIASMVLPPVTEVLASAQGYPVPASVPFSFVSITTGAPMPTTTWNDPSPSLPSSSVSSGPPLVSRGKKEDVPRYLHRLVSIHSRRQTPSNGLINYDGISMTPDQVSIAKGYSDGFLTAKLFASCAMSKLGFTGQYIADSIQALGPTVIAPGTEDCYTDWFMKGLKDGEAIVSAAVNPAQNVFSK